MKCEFARSLMNQRFAELKETFTKLIAERRAESLDGLTSGLVSDESLLSDDEVISMITVLMFAGHETTTGLLGNSLVALAHHPDQRELLRSQPDLIDNAVEELLRFDTTRPPRNARRHSRGAGSLRRVHRHA